MSSPTMTLELSVSFVSWINDQLKEELQSRSVAPKTDHRRFILQSAVVMASLASICISIASIIRW